MRIVKVLEVVGPLLRIECGVCGRNKLWGGDIADKINPFRRKVRCPACGIDGYIRLTDDQWKELIKWRRFVDEQRGEGYHGYSRLDLSYEGMEKWEGEVKTRSQLNAGKFPSHPPPSRAEPKGDSIKAAWDEVQRMKKREADIKVK
jgi:hypothetical protein